MLGVDPRGNIHQIFIVIAATLYFGAQLVVNGSLTAGEPNRWNSSLVYPSMLAAASLLGSTLIASAQRPVCAENPIRVDDVTESPKPAE